jgi:hypothetical protein
MLPENTSLIRIPGRSPHRTWGFAPQTPLRFGGVKRNGGLRFSKPLDGWAKITKRVFR